MKFLLDHQIDEKIVVPFVCAIDLFFKKFPYIHSVKNFKLMKGVILKNLEDFHDYEWHQEQPDHFVLKNKEGGIHYKTELCETRSFSNIDCPDVQMTISPYYPFVFHGPMLQSLEGFHITAKGAYASIKTSLGMKWKQQDWKVDPAMADGALQLGCFLTGAKRHKISLPILIEEIHYLRSLILDEHVKCVFEMVNENPLKYIVNVYFFDKKGMFLVFKGLHMIYKNKVIV